MATPVPTDADGFNGLIDITYDRMALAGSLMFGNMFISIVFQLGITKDLFVATIRCALQLVAIGFVLIYLFDYNHGAVNFSMAVFMLTLGAVESASKTEYFYKGSFFTGLFPRAWLSLSVAGFGVLIFALLVILQVQPWYDAQYVIAIFGMQLGNAVSATALGVDKCLSSFAESSDIIEVYIAMGADRIEASQDVLAQSVRIGIMYTLNSLAVMGLVFIPGMMSGQIMAGVPGDLAARYQITIMYIIATTSFFATIIAVLLSIQKLFRKSGTLDISVLMQRQKSKKPDVLAMALKNIWKGTKAFCARCCGKTPKKKSNVVRLRRPSIGSETTTHSVLSDIVYKLPDYGERSPQQGKIINL